jgi:hypothetical protein
MFNVLPRMDKVDYVDNVRIADHPSTNSADVLVTVAQTHTILDHVDKVDKVNVISPAGASSN